MKPDLKTAEQYAAQWLHADADWDGIPETEPSLPEIIRQAMQAARHQAFRDTGMIMVDEETWDKLDKNTYGLPRVFNKDGEIWPNIEGRSLPDKGMIIRAVLDAGLL